MRGPFQGRPCPKCGKKGLTYADHPHAFGWKDRTRAVCRYCNARFVITIKVKDPA